ncbi:MAG: helix-turn-helix domain-containing protein [Clostridia bacterium]|nr:helix-turn-helix domain-containing protein [Clostridia bacterium]
MFNENLKKYRTAAGLSQSELAEKLFVTRQCVSKWEQGTNQPDLETLQKLSEILNVSVDELVCGNESAEKIKAVNVNKKLFCICVLASVFLTAVIFVFLRFLPETIPAHFTDGKIDRYGSKLEVLYHLASVAAFWAVDILVYFALKKTTDNKAAAIAHGVMTFILAAYFVFIWVIYCNYLDVIPCATCVSAVLLIILSAAMHPKWNKQNSVFGVRCRATLENPLIWNKVNAFACYLLTAVSVAIFTVNMIVPFSLSFLTLISYVIAVLIPLVYCKILSHRLDLENQEE